MKKNDKPISEMTAEEIEQWIYEVHEEKMIAIEEKDYATAAKMRDMEKKLMDAYVRKVAGKKE